MNNIPNTLSDTEIRTVFKSLQRYIKLNQDLTPQKIIQFLKTQGLTSEEELKFFIQKSNDIIRKQTMNDFSKSQKTADVYNKLPSWAKYGSSKFGYNPSNTF